MNYSYLKALHIVGVVSWFAGLLYIVRLFVYHVEAAQKKQTELVDQFTIMERRLFFGIISPAMYVTLFSGLFMMWQIRAWEQSWFQAKGLWLVGLFAYQLQVGQWRKKLAGGTLEKSSGFFRIQNEVATVLLVALVFTAVTKEVVSAAYALGGFLLLALLIMTGIAIYKNRKPA